jgi:hypothetical protein
MIAANAAGLAAARQGRPGLLPKHPSPELASGATAAPVAPSWPALPRTLREAVAALIQDLENRAKYSRDQINERVRLRDYLSCFVLAEKVERYTVDAEHLRDMLRNYQDEGDEVTDVNGG